MINLILFICWRNFFECENLNKWWIRYCDFCLRFLEKLYCFCNFCCNVKFKNKLVVIFDFMLINVIKLYYLCEENGFGGNFEELLYIIFISLLKGLK